MNLDIALELDHDRVRLLRRAGLSATELGTLKLDDPAFDKRLAALRNGVCGEHTDVEVVLPRSLVLLLEVGDAGEAEVAILVEGETSCPMEALVIGRDGPVVAAVERATLVEARDFAEAHGFRAAAFAAHAGNGSGEGIPLHLEPQPEPRAPTFRSQRCDSEGPPASEEAEVAELATDAPLGSEPLSEARGAAPEEPPVAQGAAVPRRALVEVSRPANGRTDPVSPEDLPDPSDAGPALAGHAAHPRWLELPTLREATPPLTPSEPDATSQGEHFESEPPERDDADDAPPPATFRHFEPEGPAKAELPTPSTTEERTTDGAPPAGRWRVPPEPPAAPVVASPRAATRKTPSLTSPKLQPAANEADSLTVFGARGEQAEQARGFGVLRVAATALAAGLLIAAYQLFVGGPGELGIVDLEDAATDSIDPVTEATDDVEETPPDQSVTESAGLDPGASVAPAPRPTDALPPGESGAGGSETPRSDLATPVALPAPDALESTIPLAAPSLPPLTELGEPDGFTPPPPPGTVFDMDERGLVRPTEDGSLTPSGVLVYSGPPEVVPPAAAVGAVEAPATTEDLADGPEDAALQRPDDAPLEAAIDIPPIRPQLQPEDAVAAPVVTALQAQEDTPRPAARPTTGEAIVAAEPPPSSEPDFDALARQARTQTAAAAAGIATAAPRAAEPPPPEPEGRANVPVQPSAPTSAAVAERATVEDALHLNQVNLIGVYGTASDRRALIRLPTGRYVKVKVGDAVDGGRVASIDGSSVEYVRDGRRYALTLPSG